MFGVLTSAALIVGVTAIGIVPAVAAPSASVSPSSGLEGSTATVTGSGYLPGFSPCSIYIGLTKETAVEISSCTVDGNGLVSEQISIPATLASNVYTVFICNFCLDPVIEYEFSEVGETTFRVLKPPPPATTTTISPTTSTTTTSSTTTTTANATTTTEAPEEEQEDPVSGALPILINGRAIPRIGPESTFADAVGSPWEPIRITDDLLQLPDYWVLRCGAPPGSQIVDFDDQELATEAVLTSSGISDTVYFSAASSAPTPVVVAPLQGTWTAPYAAQMGIRPSPSGDFSRNATKIMTYSQFTYFGLRIGLVEDIDTPVVIELAARAGEGTYWDIDRIELGPTASPATTCLMVTAPEGESFREVQLGIYSETDDRVDVLLDNVYWSSVDPYPITPTPDPIDVEIIFPLPSSTLTTARNTSVIGRVTWPSSRRIGTVAIATPTWDNTGVVVRRAELANATTDGQERSALFWLDAIEVPDEFEDEKFRILVFMCENDAYPALDIAGLNRIRYSPFVRVIPVRCLGSVNMVWVREAMNSGIDGVLLIGCKYGEDYQCHFATGSELAETRLENMREAVERMQIEPERLQLTQLAINEYDKLPALINEFVEQISEMGMNPMREFQ